MVFVKVRETYDLHTTKNKMTVIAIHTPKPDIIKANFPGLLMQCKAYRPYSCDVRIACASVLPVDPQGVGLSEGDVAPEDLFNPILYSAMSNMSMSQLEARIAAMALSSFTPDVAGNSADVEVDTTTTATDEFPIYYGLLSNAHGWKHANPQSGLEMTNLRPLVYEMLYNVGDQSLTEESAAMNVGGYVAHGLDAAGGMSVIPVRGIRGNAKPLPFINCTSYTGSNSTGLYAGSQTGFQNGSYPNPPKFPLNAEMTVPYINCVVAGICIPPSRLHELFYRMVVEWTIEFTGIRPISEITDWTGLGRMADLTHYQNYDYSAVKEVVTGDSKSMLEKDACMVSANVDVNKVM